MAGDESEAWAVTLARVGDYAVELQDVFDRILTLSTAAIALIATFAEKFSGGSVWIGTVSLIAFAVTIVSCLSVRAAVATWKLSYVRTDGPPVPPQSWLSEPVLKALRELPGDDPRVQLEIARMEKYEAVWEARHQRVSVIFSKRTGWLVISMGLGLLGFVIALGFLAAFGVSALS
jgi:hypothetical protein